MDREWVTPISLEVRRALDRVLRERPGLGAGPLFPAPGRREKPASRHLAAAWLAKAEKLAGLEPQEGSQWHACRRGWATARKHLPVVDVAAAGGWRSASVVQNIYQQADRETMLNVVLHPAELWEAR